MTATILLVTGSRALADRADSAAWARGILYDAIRTPARPRVYTGDASGPDTWAIALAGSGYTQWARDGAIYCWMGAPDREGWWIEPPHPPVLPRTRDEWRRRLLARDRAMVAHAALWASRGDTVRVLALRAPWSETHGTDYTAQHARAAGLDVRVLTYPEVP